MAAKLLHSLTDDNSDLQKQIGCMTGILQLFDRQHMLTGGGSARRSRRLTPRRRFPPGSSSHNNNVDVSEGESNGYLLKSDPLEKYAHKSMFERRRMSTESSRASCSSSSRSSPFSSPDHNRAAQPEPTSFDEMIFSEIPSRDTTTTMQHPSPQFSRTSIDLRDFVKDSMYREIQGLSIKSKPTESKTSVDQRDRTPTDLKESLRALAKLQEVSTRCNEPRQLFRSSSCHFKDAPSSSRDAPRFSYDGRDLINRAPFDAGDVSKSSMKLKDLPRLSLDSRDGKSISGNQARPSVVAKLMGLEMLPVDSDDTSSSRKIDEEFVDTSSSFEKIEPIKTKGSWKEPSSPRWRSPDGSMKPMSRISIEPAPWKQIDGSKGSQKPVSKSSRLPAKASTASFPSVYSEIEKRLKDLEFNQSGKDLRALKQILEAMQAKGLLEMSKEGQHSNFANPGDEDQILSGSLRLVENRKLETRKKLGSSQNHESSIVIMKPVKLVEKSGPSYSAVSTKDQIFKTNERSNSLIKASKTAPSATRLQPLGKESNAGSGKSSGSVSPRMQQKKPEPEKRSRPPTPTSPDSSRSTRQQNKLQVESNSPGGGRRRLRHPNNQKIDDRMSPSSSTKASELTISDLKSTLTMNEDESIESGFVPPEHSSPVSVLENVLGKQDSPSRAKFAEKTPKVETSTTMTNETSVVAIENFAPISTESGVAFEINRKKLRSIENLVQKLQRLNSTHDEARTDYIASLCENADPDHRYVSEILLASGLLLRDLTDFKFHPSGHPVNPELFLVLEQTTSSNSSKGQCGSGKKSRSAAGRIHRKLIFDVANEILAGRLAPKGLNVAEPWIRPVKVARKTDAVNGQKLLREICNEIDGLRGSKNSKCSDDVEIDVDDFDDWKSILCDDVTRRSGRWTEFDEEVSGAVLDIERLIFKDLVSEIVVGDTVKNKLSRK
ncbi:protein LONGIFOLIA 1-like isoform X2 [Andrographis paniculata]|uniref:protein LONGIFOLIA 1-like isoform X2 n=1 Tax=Andrographis paniculata TaxID=175694 RepID=UPI0021E79401|nr:protein LONGIFOLIA 1-like isoform X2 [Andrographis paniculata]